MISLISIFIFIFLSEIVSWGSIFNGVIFMKLPLRMQLIKGDYYSARSFQNSEITRNAFIHYPFQNNSRLDVNPIYTIPNPYDSVYNYGIDVCTNDTFLLLLFPIRSQDKEMRSLIRELYPQGLNISNKVVNHLFVVSVMDNDRDIFTSIRNEMKEFGDMIISRNPETYFNIPLKVWDGYFWIANHCSTTTFVGKFDPDAIILIGNMIAVLQSLPTEKLYAGHVWPHSYYMYNENTKWSIPSSYKPDNDYEYFVSGPAVIISKDLIALLAVGAYFEPVFVLSADDVMNAVILRRNGVFAKHIHISNCKYLIHSNSLTIDWNNCFCVYHHIKDIEEYKMQVALHRKRIYKISLTTNSIELKYHKLFNKSLYKKYI